MTELEPQKPQEAGVDPGSPELTQIEGARLLATDARARLRAEGFNDRQIDEWADAFVREVGAGDVDGFIKWVADQQD